jgi:hypothetical protein
MISLENFLKTNWLDNHGVIDPSWKVFETEEAAWFSAGEKALENKWNQKRLDRFNAERSANIKLDDEPWHKVWRSVYNWTTGNWVARDAAWTARIAFEKVPPHTKAEQYLNVWQQGFGLVGDIDGVLYVYKHK